MDEYKWSCHACDGSNEASAAFCATCGCPAECDSHVVDLHKYLYEKHSGGRRLDCPACKGPNLVAEYDQDYKQYFYSGFLQRQWLFRILSIVIRCRDCQFSETTEFKVTFARSLFRRIVGRDISSQRLQDI